MIGARGHDVGTHGESALATALGLPVVIRSTVDIGRCWPLFPAEEATVAGSAPQRRAQFAAARACARAAMRDLMIEPAAILPVGGTGPMWRTRAPRWPHGVVGSLTHTAGFAAAALGRSEHVGSVGLDVEPDLALPHGVWDSVHVDGEDRCVADLAQGDATIAGDRLVFSAKEAVFKAWFPLTGRWLGFDDCQVDLRPDGTFCCGPTGDADPSHRLLEAVIGRWRVTSRGGTRHLLTAAAVPACIAPVTARTP